MKRINYNLLHLIYAGKADSVNDLCSKDRSLVNSFTPNSWSPLLEAVIQGQVSIVKILLQLGANVNHQDDFGNSALILLTNINPDRSYIRLKNSITYWFINLLLMFLNIFMAVKFVEPSNILIFYSFVSTCFTLFFLNHNVIITSVINLILLVTSGFIIGFKSYVFLSIFLLFSLIVMYLKDIILSNTIKTQYINILKMLLSHGIDKNLKNIYNQTALDLAILTKNKDIITLLQ